MTSRHGTLFERLLSRCEDAEHACTSMLQHLHKSSKTKELLLAIAAFCAALHQQRSPVIDQEMRLKFAGQRSMDLCIKVLQQKSLAEVWIKVLKTITWVAGQEDLCRSNLVCHNGLWKSLEFFMLDKHVKVTYSEDADSTEYSVRELRVTATHCASLLLRSFEGKLRLLEHRAFPLLQLLVKLTHSADVVQKAYARVICKTSKSFLIFFSPLLLFIRRHLSSCSHLMPTYFLLLTCSS